MSALIKLKWTTQYTYLFLFFSCSFLQNAVIRTPATTVKFRPKQRRKPSIKSTVITRRYNIVRRPHHQGSESVTATLSGHIRFISWPPSWANSPSTNSSSANSSSAQSSWKAALTPRDNLAQKWLKQTLVYIIIIIADEENTLRFVESCLFFYTQGTPNHGKWEMCSWTW